MFYRANHILQPFGHQSNIWDCPHLNWIKSTVGFYKISLRLSGMIVLLVSLTDPFLSHFSKFLIIAGIRSINNYIRWHKENPIKQMNQKQNLFILITGDIWRMCQTKDDLTENDDSRSHDVQLIS